MLLFVYVMEMEEHMLKCVGCGFYFVFGILVVCLVVLLLFIVG